MEKNFIFKYFIIALALITIYSDVNFLSNFLNEYQSKTTLFLLDSFLGDNLNGKYIQINNNYRIVINSECNGLIPIIIILSAILAYKSPIIVKLKWIIISYFLYTVINIIRILIITYTAYEYGRPSFFWTHDILGNIILLSFGLLIFVLFTKDTDTLSKN